MKLKKTLSILLILSTIFITGCWNSREINTLALAACIGIDKAENGYRVTEQIINPKAIASKKSTNESPVIIYTETGRDIFEILRRMTTQCPRKIYFSHLRMVVFSEEVAREGIRNIVDFMARDHEFRTDFYFIIAKGISANAVLNTLSNLESIPGIEMYTSLKSSERVWSPTKAVRIIELVNSITADGKNPVLTGIEIADGDENSDSIDVLKKSDGLKKLKYTHLGVLKDDQLVGWLTEDESKGYNYVTGNVRSTVGYIYTDTKDKITVETMEAKTNMRALLENGKPVINVDIKVKLEIGNVEGQFDVTKEENLIAVNKLNEERIKKLCDEAVKKVQKDYKTDIFGFGEAIHRQYPKLWKELKSNWDEEFSNLKVNYTVKSEIMRLGQVTKPYFIKEKN